MNEADLPSEKRVCVNCVGDQFLKELIRKSGEQAICSYCEGDESNTFSIEDFADRIERAFDEHYERTPTQPDGFESAMQYSERDGESAVLAIADAAKIDESVAEDVRSVLEDRHSDFERTKMGEECPFDVGSHYADRSIGHEELSIIWRGFENRLKTEARFFSRSAQTILEQIFANLSELRTSDGATVVVPAGPETCVQFLYRARVFAAEDEKLKEALVEPWKHLGTPPANAASAGRMNARGIAVFYGTEEPDTAIAEVRPPVGSKVAVAEFFIERPLRLLDLQALQSVQAKGSIFDPNYIGQIQRANFLETLSGLLSRPIMPNEAAFEYLPTQAVADYLANDVKLDGIVFPSVQAGGKSSNVVLFHHAARVEGLILPSGTKTIAKLEDTDSDGVHPDYVVWEEVPKNPAPPSDWSPQIEPFHPNPYDNVDQRPASLKIDMESIKVHHIKAVKFDADEYDVRRHRSEVLDGEKNVGNWGHGNWGQAIKTK